MSAAANRPILSPAEWAAINGDVAEALRGKPSSHTGRELRFGQHGSLPVQIASTTGAGAFLEAERGHGRAGQSSLRLAAMAMNPPTIATMPTP